MKFEVFAVEGEIMGETFWQGPWRPFREFPHEVGQILGRLELPGSGPRFARGAPAINLDECEQHFILTALVPGLAPSDVDVSIAGEMLTIRGERHRIEGVPDEAYRRQERFYGRWTRVVTLPCRIKGDEVSASYANGVLSVVLPKEQEAQPRQISIQAGHP